MNVDDRQLIFHIVLLPVLPRTANQNVLSDNVDDAHLPRFVVLFRLRVALEEQLGVSGFQQGDDSPSEKYVDLLELCFLRAHCAELVRRAFRVSQPNKRIGYHPLTDYT